MKNLLVDSEITHYFFHYFAQYVQQLPQNMSN